jgi:sec-independent protein translocase protein TatA
MGLSLGHLLILALVILLFGTRRLPELGTALGKSVKAFREALGHDSKKKDGE